MARYSVFAVLTSVLAVSVVFTMVVAADAPHDYAKQLVGCWLGARKFDVYHADGTFGFKRTKTHQRRLEAAGEWRATSLSSRVRLVMVSLLLRTPLFRARTTRSF